MSIIEFAAYPMLMPTREEARSINRASRDGNQSFGLKRGGPSKSSEGARAAHASPFASFKPSLSGDNASKVDRLANSYEYNLTLERFLMETYKKGWPFQTEKLPQPPEYGGK
jgi:hypothetical protein